MLLLLRGRPLPRCRVDVPMLDSVDETEVTDSVERVESEWFSLAKSALGDMINVGFDVSCCRFG